MFELVAVFSSIVIFSLLLLHFMTMALLLHIWLQEADTVRSSIQIKEEELQALEEKLKVREKVSLEMSHFYVSL